MVFDDCRNEGAGGIHVSPSTGLANQLGSTFSKEIAGKLIDKLSTDDAFRARFVLNPRAALRDLGHETAVADLGIVGRDAVLAFTVLRGGLASKEAVSANRDALMAVLSERATENVASGYAFHQFDICAD